MNKRKSMQVLGVLAVLWSSTPIVLAADDPAYPLRDLGQSMIHQPPVLSDGSAAANDAVTSVQIPATPQAAKKPASKPVPSEPASQPDESFNDRFIALGLAAGLLAFAFFRRKNGKATPL